MKTVPQKKHPFLITSCALTVLICGFCQTQALAETVDKIVARVGTDVITLSDIASAVAQQRNYLFQKYGKEEGLKKFMEFRKDALDELILDRILRNEIKKEGLEPTDQELSQEYNLRLQQMKTTEMALRERLSAEGITLQQYKDNISYDLGRQRLIQKKIMPRVSVSDYDLQKEYEKNLANYQTYNKFRFIEVFLTPDKFSSQEEMSKMAKQIHDNFLSRKPVGDLIKKYSSGAFASQSGDSGLVPASDLRPEIQSVLSRLNINEISPAMPTAQGIFIFKLLARADPKPMPYNEVSTQVRNRYTDQIINDELKKYLLAIKDQTFVEITP